jgi:hypothetical protein
MPNDRIPRIISWALLGAMLVNAGLFVSVSIKRIYLPFELDYGEGIVLWQAQHILNPALAYKSLQTYPYVVFHYPPLFHFAARLVATLTGDLLIAGRWVSSLCSLGSAFLIGLLVYLSAPNHVSRFWRCVIVAVAALLPFTIEAMDWGSLMRVDMIAIFLTLAGLVLFASGAGVRRVYAGMALMVLAMFAKQTMVAAPLACLLVAAVMKPRRALLVFGGGVLLGASLLLAGQWLTHGEFGRHLFLYNQNPFSVSQLWRATQVNLQKVTALVAMAALMCAILTAKLTVKCRRGGLPVVRSTLEHSRYWRLAALLSAYWCFAGLMTLTAGKVGANRNYMLEFNLACCPLAGLLFLRMWAAARKTPFAVALPFSLVILLTIESCMFLVPRRTGGNWSGTEGQKLAREERQLTDLIRLQPGPVLSENMTALVRAGKEVPAEPAIVTVLATRGMWDESPLLELLRRRQFSRVVVQSLDNQMFYTPGVRAAIEQHYTVSATIGRYTVYEPGR